jgi:glycosyltransferase involved in cell wall biosynthesis
MLCQLAPSAGVDVTIGAPLPSMIVAANDAASAREYERTLRAQEWPVARVVFPVAAALAAARDDGAYIVVLAPGVKLAPHALERAWWALDTRPDVGFIAFGDERGATTPMLESCAICMVARAAWLTESTLNSDARWPGIAPLFGLLEQGRRGHLVREPLLARSVALKATDAPWVRAVAELRAKGLTDAMLGDAGHDGAPDSVPQQALDERPLPVTPAPVKAPHGRHRVLALLQGFPMGGYTAFNADFLPRLVKQGHAVTVCTTEVWRTEWRLDGVRAVVTDVVHANGVVPLESQPRFVSFVIASRGIDVVLLSHSMTGYRMLAWLRRRHPNTAFVDYVHTDWFEAQMYGSYAALGAASASWLDAQVASSRSLADDLVARGADAARTSAVTINLDTDDWNPARFPGDAVRAALGCTPGQRLVLFAGRLSPEKRPLLAVECWRALIESGVDARFAVAGGGPLLAPMVEAIKLAGLADRVEFLGELEGDMLRYVYSAADVYHAPSEIEGIARTLYETMAMGCVPVVADVGGQRELVSEACGYLVAHGPDEVARYVAALRSATRAPAAAHMQRASRARIVQHFNAARCVAGFERVFETAIAHRAAEQALGAPSESAAAARELAIGGLETARRHFWRAQGR